jgi:hypothetical protein
MAIVELVLTGFCRLLEYPPGPVHAYVAPAGPAVDVRFNEAPVHKGLLLVIVGAEG